MAKSPKSPSKRKPAVSKKPSLRGKATTDRSIKPAKPFVVRGRVTSPDRALPAGLLVEILDQSIGSEFVIAETQTDAAGEYKATFGDSNFRSRGKDRPDVRTRVRIGQTTFVSEIRYNASLDETLDILLPANVTELPSEYESLTAAVAPYWRKALSDLQESETRADITYLGNKTGWDARAVAMAALANKFSRAQDATAPIPPELFYALFRAGLPADENVLYHTEANTLSAVWKQAVAQGVIPNRVAQQIPGTIEQFQNLRAQKLLHGPVLAGASTFTDMLTVANLNETQKQQFAQAYAAHRGDLPAFWNVVHDTFGQEVADRLQLHGKLAFLTINNAPLMGHLDGKGSLLQLARAGYHRSDKWAALLTDRVPIPPEISGETEAIKRENYAKHLGAQLRLSYPTAAVAELVEARELPVEHHIEVSQFLTEHMGEFEIGVHPIDHYIARKRINVEANVVDQVRRLQRVYQMTKTDDAMSVLLENKMDAAYHIAQVDHETFVKTFGEQLGGPEAARQVHDRATQVHAAVLNIAVSYLTARNGVPLGKAPLQAGEIGLTGQVLQPVPKAPTAEDAASVIAYPTLEGLFGSMDFCACEECRSILSPAAYLVDLLQFIDKPGADGKKNPQAVLLGRRPDIQHLPLTCENTNTALPYIDLVNETLECFVANRTKPNPLDGYQGHDTGGTGSEDLLATPQYVMDAAYDTLQNAWFPPPLPFHQPLESLRRYFNKFDVPLQSAMEQLCQTNELDRGSHSYGWRDILMEELSLSRQEYRLLTDSTLTWKQVFGFDPNKPDGDAVDVLLNAKQFARRVGITYEELVSLLKTRFINPNVNLIPKLERLGVPFATIQALLDEHLSDKDFLALLPTGANAPDPAQYGGDIVDWIKKKNYGRIKTIITLTDTASSGGNCDFGRFALRYAIPQVLLSPLVLRRILRFIRLWKQLGWTIEQTDAAMCAVVDPGSIETEAELDAAFLTLLPRLGIVKRVMRTLGLSPERDLASLLACSADIGIHGEHALYRQMFLNPTMLKQDPAFADNGYGEFLTDSTKKLLDHAEALRGAFNLTGDEFNRIVQERQYDNSTPLTLPNISNIFRRGWLSRKLGLSVQELQLLSAVTGLDPFALVDFKPTTTAQTDGTRFLSLVQALKARSMRPATALYLVWHEDMSGRSSPDLAPIVELARSLRTEFATIDHEIAVGEGSGSNVFRARLALVYGQETANAFYAHLENRLEVSVSYAHLTSSLDPVITVTDPDLTYDSFRHRLSHIGVISSAQRDALKAVPGVSNEFKVAVDDLFSSCAQVRDSFFLLHPELRPLYDAYTQVDTGLVASVNYTHTSATLEPEILAADRRLLYKPRQQVLSHRGVMTEAMRDALRDTLRLLPITSKVFLPAVDELFNQGQSALTEFFSLVATFQGTLAQKRKREQALQRVAAAAGADLHSTRALLDPTHVPGTIYPLHAAADRNQPVLNDVLAVGTQGLTAEFFFRDKATGTVDQRIAAVANLDYSTTNGHPLPQNPTGATISGIWSGALEVPETSYYNIIIAADVEAVVTLKFDGKDQPLIQSGTLRQNRDPLELKTGTIHEMVLTVEKVKSVLSVKWESQKQRLQVIPGAQLYPSSVLHPFQEAFVRFLKLMSLGSNLRLTTSEIAYLATDPDSLINGEAWLNHIPTKSVRAPNETTALMALLKPFWGLLDFAHIKADWSPDDERVLTVLKDPTAATASTDSLLFKLSSWNKPSLVVVLQHLGIDIKDLGKIRLLRRIYDAFAPIQHLAIPASKLISATTNEPSSSTVRELQAALRARFDAASWRDVVRPINDSLRGLQRDALVAYILHQMRESPTTAHIDTADKLFEYFLMDVEMDPCMQTSRIRNALSTVQLFVERCWMNLEPDMSSAFSKEDAEKWTWMKRYRMWEANRKVFMFPENWLEPELRDDKSPFFKEIESQLLQSDITDDSAASTVLDYLAKLDEVARLEPCGMCYNEKTTEGRDVAEDDVAHVVARTTGAHRLYYHRRYEFGSWTPWEHIKLDIEDNPVIPVVWRNRLLLLWLRTIKQGPQTLPVPKISDKDVKLSDQTVASLLETVKNSTDENLRMSVAAALCWSEYLHGKWQAVRTSDINAPMPIGEFSLSGAGAFDRSKLGFFTYNAKDGTLFVIPYYGKLDGGHRTGYFILDNAQRARIGGERNPSDDLLDIPNRLCRIRIPFVSEGRLTAVHKWASGPEDEREILSFKTSGSDQMAASDLRSDWWGPFLFADFQYTYWVTVSESAPSAKAYLDYGISHRSLYANQTLIPALTVKPFSTAGAALKRNANSAVGPAAHLPLAQFVRRDECVGSDSSIGFSLTYGSRLIGPWGAIAKTNIVEN